MVNISKINKEVENVIIEYLTTNQKYKKIALNSQYTMVISHNDILDCVSIDIIDCIENKTANIFYLDEVTKKDFNIKKLSINNTFKAYYNKLYDYDIFEDINNHLTSNSTTFKKILEITANWELIKFL